MLIFVRKLTTKHKQDIILGSEQDICMRKFMYLSYAMQSGNWGSNLHDYLYSTSFHEIRYTKKNKNKVFPGDLHADFNGEDFSVLYFSLKL